MVEIHCLRGKKTRYKQQIKCYCVTLLCFEVIVVSCFGSCRQSYRVTPSSVLVANRRASASKYAIKGRQKIVLVEVST